MTFSFFTFDSGRLMGVCFVENPPAGTDFARCVKNARRKPGATWHPDKVFVTPRGEPWHLFTEFTRNPSAF
ncbi:hypothetical protein BN2476_930010 [Paraburkholderia piptadeniae]|uniref:Uncharacterized protein n=1 Tax=Paraburkholderia piptadeniae TaxID=1701573 RepID=A0A1N7STQ1_9BURK|nr:hypothetical protein BN2476_930010 [Paraburkholderia piptadeniae]